MRVWPECIRARCCGVLPVWGSGERQQVKLMTDCEWLGLRVRELWKESDGWGWAVSRQDMHRSAEEGLWGVGSEHCRMGHKPTWTELWLGAVEGNPEEGLSGCGLGCLMSTETGEGASLWECGNGESRYIKGVAHFGYRDRGRWGAHALSGQHLGRVTGQVHWRCHMSERDWGGEFLPWGTSELRCPLWLYHDPHIHPNKQNGAEEQGHLQSWECCSFRVSFTSRILHACLCLCSSRCRKHEKLGSLSWIVEGKKVYGVELSFWIYNSPGKVIWHRTGALEMRGNPWTWGRFQVSLAAVLWCHEDYRFGAGVALADLRTKQDRDRASSSLVCILSCSWVVSPVIQLILLLGHQEVIFLHFILFPVLLQVHCNQASLWLCKWWCSIQTGGWDNREGGPKGCWRRETPMSTCRTETCSLYYWYR